MNTVVFYAARSKAIATVMRAIYKGRLPRLRDTPTPCADCGARATQYDHRDYHRPLEVEPVCQRCNIARGPAQLKAILPEVPTLPLYHCCRCAHHWTGRKASLPIRCPKCQSVKWNAQR